MNIAKLLFTVITVALVFFSCKKAPQDNLIHTIPSNAAYVMYVDGKSLKDKSENYDIFKNLAVSRGINMAKAFLNKQEAIDMLDAFTKDVNSLGINIVGDCYVFSDGQISGLVMAVNDAEKIKNALINFSAIKDESELEEENGVYILPMTSKATVIWNKEKLLLLGEINAYSYVLGSSENKVDVKELAKKYLLQGEAESILSNASFAKFMNNKKDISLFYTYSNESVSELMEDMAGINISAELKKEMEDMKGVSMAFNTTFEKGEIKSDFQTFYETPELEKKYNELVASISGKLKGDQLKYIPENPLLMFSTSLKGNGMYDYLSKLGIMNMFEKNVSDSTVNIRSLFNNVEGDLSFAFNNIVQKEVESYGYTYNSTSPLFAFFVDLKDEADIMKLISNNQEGLEKINETTYTFDMGRDGGQAYLGIANKMFYFTNDKYVYDNINSTDLKNRYGNLANGKLVVVSGDLQRLKDLLPGQIDEENIQNLLISGINQIGTYTYAINEDMTGQGSWQFTDKNKNSFAVICHFLDDILLLANDYMNFSGK